ncbi:MAG: Antitoxin Phd YefM, type toxin-antitoxin system, partial [Actinomycetota bacterium]
MTITVGVFEAKTRLSELLENVQHGEEVIITKRGQPIASL